MEIIGNSPAAVDPSQPAVIQSIGTDFVPVDDGDGDMLINSETLSSSLFVTPENSMDRNSSSQRDGAIIGNILAVPTKTMAVSII